MVSMSSVVRRSMLGMLVRTSEVRSAAQAPVRAPRPHHRSMPYAHHVPVRCSADVLLEHEAGTGVQRREPEVLRTWE